RAVSDVVRAVTNPEMLESLAEMGLGEAFLRDFVEQCLKDARACHAELAKAAACADWAEFREATHALKGIAENLGAQSMAERCSQLMRAQDEALAREQAKAIAELGMQIAAVGELSLQQVARLTRPRLHERDAPDAS
ncbi:MAG TPA: Hpt domain-containing protein, partial [Lysobacter sp.]